MVTTPIEHAGRVPAQSRARGALRDLGVTTRHIGIVVAFLVAHVILAVAMRSFQGLSTIHALATFAVGIAIASTTKKTSHIAAVVAYIAGAEVLWRMTQASVFWEFGKYAIIAVLLLGLLRMRARRNRGLALAYWGFLIPSIALTLMTLELEPARQEVSFTLSGPLALTVAVIFFSNIQLTLNQRAAAFVALIGPVVGVATLSFISTATTKNLEFVNAANMATSGGYGPNQVAAVLGLAVMFLLLISLERRLPWSLRIPMFLLAATLGTQSALTFARGGLVLAAAGSVAAMFMLLRGNRRARLTVVFVASLVFVVGKFVIEPRLESMTRGELSQRYASTKSSGRDKFIASEMEMFASYPVMGVGPGISTHLRAQSGVLYGASHTEYSRMLAEHGILGILSLCCLVWLAVRAVRQQRDAAARAIPMALVIWAALFLLVYGTRIAAPSLIFGMAFALRAVPARPAVVART